MAFIKTTDKENLLSELRKVQNQEIVIHYNCKDCDDEQVTDWIEIEPYMLDQIETEGSLYVSYPCTNCSHTEKFLEPQFIQGIETE